MMTFLKTPKNLVIQVFKTNFMFSKAIFLRVRMRTSILATTPMTLTLENRKVNNIKKTKQKYLKSIKNTFRSWENLKRHLKPPKKLNLSPLSV